MRIVLSTVPAPGHLFPLLPLGRALRARGHTVGVLTSKGMAPVIEPEGFDLLPAGPMHDAMLAEVARRHGGGGMFRPTPDGFGEMFGGARLDLTADEALQAGSAWHPELLVHEYTDTVGPMLATAVGIPFATLGPGPGMPAVMTDAVTAIATQRYVERGLSLPPHGAAIGTWYLDNCPPALQDPRWSTPAQRLALRPEPYAQPWAPPPPPPPLPSTRPTVLVTFGTHFDSPAVLSPLVRALEPLDIEIALTVSPGRHVRDYDVDPARVRMIPFTPKEHLLNAVAAVLTHGGIGTVLAALSRGIPLVVVPQGADQFMQAERVAAAGAGVGLFPGAATPAAVAEAVRHVITDPAIQAAAGHVRAEIAAMPAPSVVAGQLECAARTAAAMA